MKAIKGTAVSFIRKQQTNYWFNIKNAVAENPFHYLPKKNIVIKMCRFSIK